MTSDIPGDTAHTSGTPLLAPSLLAGAAGAAVRWRAVGLAGAKAIALARSLVLAWLLVPDDFGLFAIAFVPLDLMLGVTDVGMIPALVQRREVHDRDYHVAWTVGLLRGLAISVVLMSAASLFAGVFGDVRATDIIRALALRPIIAATASIRVAQLERDLHFRSLASIDLATSIVNTVFAVLLAHSMGVWALVIGTLAGALAGVIASYVVAPHTPKLVFDRVRARSLMTFGRWVLLGGVAAMIGEGVLVATISRTLGVGATGLYSLAASLALAPAAMVGAVIGGVAFAVHARAFPDQRQVARVFRASLTSMIVVLLPAYAILTVLAPAIVERMLDTRWQGAAPVVQLLAAAGFLGLVFDATASMLAGAGRARAVTILSLLFTAIVSVVVWPLTQRFGLEGAATARIVADLVVMISCVVLIRTVLTSPFKALWLPLVSILVASGVSATVAWFITQSSPRLGALIAGGVAGIVSAILLLWVFDRWLHLGLRRDSALVIPALRQ